MAAIFLAKNMAMGEVLSVLRRGIWLLMLPSVGGICTGATGGMAANHIHLSHNHMVCHPCCVFINYVGLINC